MGFIMNFDGLIRKIEFTSTGPHKKIMIIFVFVIAEKLNFEIGAPCRSRVFGGFNTAKKPSKNRHFLFNSILEDRSCRKTSTKKLTLWPQNLMRNSNKRKEKMLRIGTIGGPKTARRKRAQASSACSATPTSTSAMLFSFIAPQFTALTSTR